MPLKIEKDIPLFNKPSKELVNVLLQMKDGDSLFVSYDEFPKSLYHSCIASARIRGIANNIKYVTRGTTGGVRVWAVNMDNKTYQYDR